MLRLFLQDYEIELNETVQFALNRQFEDLTNPTIIINDWSKTIKIPFSSHNDKIFGHIYNLDRVIADGDHKLMGVYFDPYKKIDFRLQWGDTILMTGYAKNTSVDNGSYNITLNGELGKIFQEMKKITFNTTTEDTNYLIDGSKYVKEYITKDLIYDLWHNAGGLNTTLYENTEQDYRLEEMIGFIPNNSYNEGFDYNTFQIDLRKSKKFTEVLDERAVNNGYESYAEATGIAADTVIKNGLLPREIGEFRSYLQQPYIFFNKLFQIFNKKVEEVTGYSSYLSPVWFNDSNPYWTQLVYILNLLDYKDNPETNSEIIEPIVFENYVLNDSLDSYTPNVSSTNIKTINWQIIDDIKQKFKSNEIDRAVFNQNISFEFKLNNPYNYKNEEVGSSDDYIIFGNTTHIQIGVLLYDSNGNIVKRNNNFIIGSNYSNISNIPSDFNIITVDKIRFDENREWKIELPINLSLVVDKNEVGEDFEIKLFVKFADNLLYLFYLNNIDTQLNNRVKPQSIDIKLLSSVAPQFYTDKKRRSHSKFTLNDLWNNEYNLFEQVLNYCKQFRIGILCDYINKQIQYIPLDKYFNDYSVLDWTDKVDYSKDYHIEPITFQNKYILFNYDENDTELNKEYKEKYQFQFGEYRLTTDYNFNTDTKSLFEKINVSIPATDTILSWGNVYNNLSVVYTVPSEITVINKGENNKYTNTFGSYLFYKGLQPFDTTSGLEPVIISDDTDLQILNNTYFYTQDGDSDKIVSIDTYPVLDIVYSDNISTFVKPLLNYTYQKDSYNNSYGIYENFWSEYLDERYNKQNKILTCYIYITPQDYINFQFNKFIKIQNQLYFINKIYDYQLEENIPTKVDLITIQNIESYTKNNFVIFNIYNSEGSLWNDHWDYLDIEQHTTKTIYITSNSDISWSTDQGIQNNLEVNGEVGSGRIQAGNKVPVTLYNDEYGPVEGYVEFSNGRDTQKIFVRVR